MLPTFYINDCYDDNATARYTARIQSIIPHVPHVQFVGVKTSLEAAGNLVDILDGLEDHPGLIFINVAPRGTGRWPNGTPFGYVQYNNAHIFTTVEGHALSLLQKLTGKPIPIQVFDMPTVVPYLGVDKETQEHIIHSQIRSFDFLPRVAAKVLEGGTVPSTKEVYDEACPTAIWWQDNFGNFKTTLLPEEIGFKPGKSLRLSIGLRAPLELTCYNRLKDIPYQTVGLYVGSSGLPGTRLLEITIQKGDDLHSNHAPSLPLTIGDIITI
jgi:hypothetical protein